MEITSFFQRHKVLQILFIGDFAQNMSVVQLAEQMGHIVYQETDADHIAKIAVRQPLDLIFGTLSFGKDSYYETLFHIRGLKPKIEIILFLKMEDTQNLGSILLLKCKQYLYLRTELEKATFHLKAVIHEIVNQNIFLSDTQYFEALLDSSVVSQSDVYGNITYVNKKFTEVTGYTPEEVIGKSHRILKHPDNDPELFKQMWETIIKGEVWRERMLNKKKDGSDFWADTIIIPFRDYQSGEILQYIAVRRDITQMLLEKRAVIEKERKAQEQMKLSDAKDAFLILFTHELKTPLNAIINFSYYLYRNMHRITEIPIGKRSHLIEQIYKSATSMLENVTNILDLSKLRNHKLAYTLSLFDVKEALHEVMDNHQALADELHRSMKLESDDTHPFILSDTYRFKQVLANILSNALKYGRSSVIVTLESDENAVTICIEDDGAGIEDKHIVFELYEQSKQGLSNMEKKGTGIGLNFVRLLCEDLKFEYRLEDSIRLGGTRFVLRILLKEDRHG